MPLLLVFAGGTLLGGGTAFVAMDGTKKLITLGAVGLGVYFVYKKGLK